MKASWQVDSRGHRTATDAVASRPGQTAVAEHTEKRCTPETIKHTLIESRTYKETMIITKADCLESMTYITHYVS